MNADALLAVLDGIAVHAGTLLVGATIVLGGGCLAMALQRSPQRRRQYGGWTAVAAAVYLLAALVPLPRLFQHTDAAASPASGVAGPRSGAERAPALLLALDDLGAPEPAPTAGADPALRFASPPAAAVLTAPAAAAPPVLARALTILWLVGAFAALARTLLGLAAVRRVLRTSRPAPTVLRTAVPLPARASLRVADRPVRPFCTGWLRPTIVLPAELAEPQRRPQALAVLRHEAAHLAAGDAAVQLLLAALTVPLFAHPLFWWLCRDVRFCSELLADDDAARGADRHAYVRELLDLAERDQPVLARTGAVSVFHRPSDFYRRIQMLLQREGSLSLSTTPARRASHALAALGLTAAAALSFGVPANAQDPQGRALRKENAELRNEIDTLRVELETLRLRIAELREAQAGHPNAPWPIEYRRLDPSAAPAPAPAIPGVPPVEPPAQPAPGLGFTVVEGGVAAPAPAAPAEVPMLDRVPVIAHVFRTSVPAPGTPAPPDAPGAVVLDDFTGLDMPGKGEVVSLEDVTDELAPPDSELGTTAIAELASRHLDLQADLENAEVRAEELQQLAATGNVPHGEARTAALRVRTLRKKLAVTERLIAGEVEATEAETAWLAQRRDAAADGNERHRFDQALRRASARLDTLRALK